MRTWIATLALPLASSVVLAVSFPTPTAAQSGWTPQTSGTTEELRGVDFTDANHGVAVGDAGTILHSSDGGSAWTSRSSNTTYNLNAVALGGPSAGIAVGDGLTIVRTTDGGLSWTVVMTDFFASLHGAFMLDAQLGFAAGVNSIFEPLVGRTTNGGADWTFQNFRFDGSEGTLRDVHFLSNQVGYVVGNVFTGEGAIARTTDGGTVWQTILYTNEPLLGLDFADANVGVAVGAGGAILRTTNGGTSWTPQASGTGAILEGASLPEPPIGTVVGDGGTILRTTNGSQWGSQQGGTLGRLNEVVFVNANTGWVVGANGTILHTTTGGEPPTAVTDPGAVAPLVLLPGSPNPFRLMHRVPYELPAAAAVRVEIYDSAGRFVRRLADGAQVAGRHEFAWDGTDARGSSLPTGVYVYRIEAVAGGATASRTGKMVLID